MWRSTVVGIFVIVNGKNQPQRFEMCNHSPSSGEKIIETWQQSSFVLA